MPNQAETIPSRTHTTENFLVMIRNLIHTHTNRICSNQLLPNCPNSINQSSSLVCVGHSRLRNYRPKQFSRLPWCGLRALDFTATHNISKHKHNHILLITAFIYHMCSYTKQCWKMLPFSKLVNEIIHKDLHVRHYCHEISPKKTLHPSNQSKF